MSMHLSLRRTCSRPRRASVLMLVLIVMLLLTISSLTAIGIGRDSRLRALRTEADIAARYAADAGIARTLYAMNKTLAAGLWNGSSLPVFNEEPLTGSTADYTAAVSGALGSGYQITSTGRCKAASRTVRATLKLTNPFALNFAILTQNGIQLDGKSLITGYNSSDSSQTNLPVSIGTLSDTAGAIDIKNGATVNGDVYVGMIADPETSVLLKSRQDVSGELLNQPPPLPELVAVTAPTLANKGKLIGKDLTVTAGDSGTYTSIDLSADGHLYVQGHCVMVVTGDIQLKNSAEIHVASTGSLTLYLRGNLIGGYAAGVVNESRIPARFKLYGIGVNQQIDLKNSSDFYGAVYAPAADVTIYNGGSIYGAMVVDSFELKNSGNVYYDTALQNATIYDQGAIFMITRWEEL